MVMSNICAGLGMFLLPFLYSQTVTAAPLPPLPEPVTNNAVASVKIDERQYLFSFMGLAKGKTYRDVHNRAWQLKIDKNGNHTGWQAIPSVPSSLPLAGRLAAVAVGVDEAVYLFGGYTVAEDHTEISAPDVYRYEPVSQTYTRQAAMPVPVDDTVALVYQQRYIYLVSGWHNSGNVNLVQVYDTQENSWQQASPFLGKPVFGQAGGIVGNTMVVCDGVAVEPQQLARRTFAAHTGCYKGQINPQNHLDIDWQKIPHPTGDARYRMAAAGDVDANQVIFVGGASNPYNYNGMGYNDNPAEPSQAIWSFDITSNQWHITQSASATMDHRGLLPTPHGWVTLGGMGPAQQVSDKVVSHRELSL